MGVAEQKPVGAVRDHMLAGRNPLSQALRTPTVQQEGHAQFVEGASLRFMQGIRDRVFQALPPPLVTNKNKCCLHPCAHHCLATPVHWHTHGKWFCQAGRSMRLNQWLIQQLGTIVLVPQAVVPGMLLSTPWLGKHGCN